MQRRQPLLRRALAASLVLASAIGLVGSCGSDKEKGGGVDTAATRQMVYVGGDGNITWYAIDGAGTLSSKGSVTYPLTAAWITKSADNKFLYAILRTTNEMAQMAAGKALEGNLQAFSIDQSSGALQEVGTPVSSQGDRPTYLTLDKTGKWLLVANNLGHQVGKSIAVFPIKDDGSIGEATQTLYAGTDPANMNKPMVRSHNIRLDPSNRFAYVANIDSDNVSQFKFDEKTGTLTLNDPPAVAIPDPPHPTTSSSPTNPMKGNGPRHVDFHPTQPWVYLSLEYGAEVAQLGINADGSLKMMPPAVSGLPDNYSTDPKDKWQSEIRVHPSGRFLYVGERARNTTVTNQTIAIFDINQQTGALTRKANEPSLGKTPRNFAIDATGNFLVLGNQDSAKAEETPQPQYPFSSIVAYRIDQSSGLLTKVSGPIQQMNPFVIMFVTLP